MRWLRSNWIWILLLIPAAFVGFEVIVFLWNETDKQGSWTWFNKLKFWNAGAGGATGAQASGENCGGRNCGSSCVPASARTCTGGAT
jgi:hypothetical protein